MIDIKEIATHQASPSIRSSRVAKNWPAATRSRSQLSDNTKFSAEHITSSFSRNLEKASEKLTIVGLPLHFKKEIEQQKI